MSLDKPLENLKLIENVHINIVIICIIKIHLNFCRYKLIYYNRKLLE